MQSSFFFYIYLTLAPTTKITTQKNYECITLKEARLTMEMTSWEGKFL